MRIDKYLAEKFGSRTKAAEAIERNLVKVNGKSVSPSYEYKDGDTIEFIEPSEKFVSNGGYKLSKALRDFDFSVSGKIVMDVGASNGGFTDCLLQNGAKKVYCIDVGESQLDESLKGNNVVVMDNYNARFLKREDFPEQIDGAVIDVSFISLTYILGGVNSAIADDGFIIALIKPQFECESKKVGKNGIVRDGAVHKKIVNKIYTYAEGLGLGIQNLTNAPEREGKNKEYLILLKKGGKSLPIEQILKYVKF